MLTGNLDKHPIQWKVMAKAPYANRDKLQPDEPVSLADSQAYIVQSAKPTWFLRIQE
jgi:hypothetical protein